MSTTKFFLDTLYNLGAKQEINQRSTYSLQIYDYLFDRAEDNVLLTRL